MWKSLIFIGVVLIIIGILGYFFEKINFKVPGDILIKKENFTFFSNSFLHNIKYNFDFNIKYFQKIVKFFSSKIMQYADIALPLPRLSNFSFVLALIDNLSFEIFKTLHRFS